MAKKLMKNYPLGIAKPMPTKIIRRNVNTFNVVPNTEVYRNEAYRPNSIHNDRPREPSV